MSFDSKKQYEYTVSKEEDSLRLDNFLFVRLNDISRSQITKAIKNNSVTVNGVLASKPGFFLRAGNVVVYVKSEERFDYLKPTDIPLEIVYEDSDLLVINKQKGLVVHPANGHIDDTLVNALRHHLGDSFIGDGDGIRPGIVHRIDKDTSGLLVVAKNLETLTSLQELLKEHKISREYYAIVHGVIPENIINVNAPIGRDRVNRQKMTVGGINGKSAISHAKVLNRIDSTFTLLEIKLETGRTHQIRVHFSYLKYPVVGDPLYGRKNDKFLEYGQFLHAFRLSFVHPRSKEKMVFETPIPKYFNVILSS